MDYIKRIIYKDINKIRKIMVIIFTILFIVSTTVLGHILLNNYTEAKSSREIRKKLTYVYEQIKDEPEEVKQNIKIQKLEQLQKINSDIIALIEIEGTNINYPVVQGKDNSYYMTHNYRKEKSKDGALFLDKACDIKLPSTNLLIYGHNNIGSSEMFVDLIKYKKESFYKKHKIINFTTNEEEAQYEIISVFLSRVYYQYETDVFRYYYFINAYNKQEFNYYINNCKKASLYDIDSSVEYGDNIMTLSTCEYSKPNGRLAVVARKITK